MTNDYVNPEHAWPSIAAEAATRAARAGAGRAAPIYPDYVGTARWLDAVRVPSTAMLRAADSMGPRRRRRVVADARAERRAATARSIGACARERGSGWTRRASCGCSAPARGRSRRAGGGGGRSAGGGRRRRALRRQPEHQLHQHLLVPLPVLRVLEGKAAETLRGAPYDLALEEVARRVKEAWARGATEVCMQGGIHPAYTGETYLALLRADQTGGVAYARPCVLAARGDARRAFAGLEHRGVPRAPPRRGLWSLPGTAAEILDDAVRARICPDKLSAGEWLDVVETAHRVGLRRTSTIMFGHVERPSTWARHLAAVRDLQERTGGITEFVPLPFVHMEAPMYLKGRARRGPTFGERCSCTRWRGSRSIRSSRTSRPRG